MDGVTVRLTSPSRSRPRSVSVSMRCDTAGMARRISEKRRAPSHRFITTRTVHLSPMRWRISVAGRQLSVTCRVPRLKNVPPCEPLPGSQFSAGSDLLPVEAIMLKLALIVGSTRPNRFADKPRDWIVAGARERRDLKLDVLD